MKPEGERIMYMPVARGRKDSERGRLLVSDRKCQWPGESEVTPEQPGQKFSVICYESWGLSRLEIWCQRWCLSSNNDMPCVFPGSPSFCIWHRLPPRLIGFISSFQGTGSTRSTSGIFGGCLQTWCCLRREIGWKPSAKCGNPGLAWPTWPCLAGIPRPNMIM